MKLTSLQEEFRVAFEKRGYSNDGH